MQQKLDPPMSYMDYDKNLRGNQTLP